MNDNPIQRLNLEALWVKIQFGRKSITNNLLNDELFTNYQTAYPATHIRSGL
jgi:hypothetical protein